MRLLVVEDHHDTAIAFARLLSMSGYEVDTARDVHSAMKLCESNSYGVLLSDIGLPDGTGWDLMKALIGRCGMRGIAISGYGHTHDIERSIEAGFSEHLTKPILIEPLLAAIERVVVLRGVAPTDGNGSTMEPRQI